MKHVLPLAVILSLAWLVSGCGSSNFDATAPAGATATPGTGFAGLPAPRQAATGESVLQLQPGTRSYLTTTMTYVDLTNSSGVTQDAPDFNLHFAPSTPQQVTFMLFGISALIDTPATLGKVSLELDWAGAPPAGKARGLYVGVADYARNAWVWRGPVISASDLLDFSGAQLGNMDPGKFMENMALVNFSDQSVVLRSVNFSTIHPGDVSGDEALFFIVSEAGLSSIQCAQFADLDHPQAVLAAGAGVELTDLQVIQDGGASVLAFNRRAPGGYWEVWQCGLDGSAPVLRYGDASQDVRFCGQDLAGNREYLMRGNYPEGSIVSLDPQTSAVDMTAALQQPLACAPRWFGNFHADFALAGVSAGVQPQLQGIYKSQYTGDEYNVPLLSILGDGATQDACFARWANGQFDERNLMFYSAKLSAETSFSIRMDDQGLPNGQNNKLFVPGDARDLRYPSISPDNLYFSFVACQPGAQQGQLYVQSAFLRSIDQTAGLAHNVTGAAVWHDPTPIAQN